MAVALAIEELKSEGGSVSIIGDDLRPFHPKYEYLMTLDDKTAAFFTDKDTGLWIEKSIQYAKKLRCHVVIEGTMRVPDAVVNTMKEFKSAGYFIDARILAINNRLSWLGVLQRYEFQRHDRGAGRMTLAESHKAAYDGLLDSAHKIEYEKLADRITIYKRGAITLYTNELYKNEWKQSPLARKVIEKERKRDWTLPERIAYLQDIDNILDLVTKPERKATAAEILFIENLRDEAHQQIQIMNVSANEEERFFSE